MVAPADLRADLAAYLPAAPATLPTTELGAPATDLPGSATAAETETLLLEDADGNLYLASYAGQNLYNGADVYALSPLGLYPDLGYALRVGWYEFWGMTEAANREWALKRVADGGGAMSSGPCSIGPATPRTRVTTDTIRSGNDSAYAFYDATAGQYPMGSPVAESMSVAPLKAEQYVACPPSMCLDLGLTLKDFADPNTPDDLR